MFFFDNRLKLEYMPRGFPYGALLSARDALDKRMSVSLKERAQTDVSFMERVEFPPEVLGALLEANNGRCAFCEGHKEDMSVYRFRPYANAQPNKASSDIDCYQWLAFDWLNLFPICSDCQPDDPYYFPVSGPRASPDGPLSLVRNRLELAFDESARRFETPMLITPGDDDRPHSLVFVDLEGRWLSLRASGKGPETIHHFNLNSERTQSMRREAIHNFLFYLLDAHPKMVTGIDFETDAFGSSLYLVLRQTMEELPARLGFRGRTSLSKTGIKASWERLAAHPDYHAKTAELLDEMRDPKAFGPNAVPREASVRVRQRKKSLEGKALRLQSVKVANFRSLKEIEFELPDRIAAGARERLNTDLERRSDTGLADVDMEDRKLQDYAPCLLILGENAAGKSTLLEAIALAAMDREVREELDEKPASYLLDAEFLGASARADGSSRVSSASVELGFIANHSGEFTDTNRSEDREVAMTLGLTPDGFAIDGKVPEGFRLPPVFAYGAQRLSGSAPRADAVRHVDTLFSADKQLSNPEKWLAALDEKTRNGVVQAIRGLIQIDGRFEAILPVETKGASPPERCKISLKKMRPFIKTETETGMERGSAVRSKSEREYTVTHRLDAVSSGYRAIIAMICDVLSGIMEATGTNAIEARREPAIVLIDEIEAHLHPRWKINLTRGLRHALPNVTFIMTSHDPLCIRGMFDEEVTVMERVSLDAAEGEIQEEVQRLNDFPSPETMTVEQLLVADFFQLATTDDTVAMDQVINYWELLEREELSRLSNQELAERGIDEPKPLTQGERDKLERFKGEIDEELPYGRTAAKQVIYAAVARVLEERRRGHRERIEQASANVRKEVRTFLESIMP
ncbi:MAG: AAA family ATPase [Pseudomonadota bacterium]